MRTYEECEKYILDIPKFAAKNELADTYRILEGLVDVTKIPHVIHVAGTNGKGSVSAFLRSILVGAGYNVGFFISPHLVDMTERIAINHDDISREEFVKVFEKVKGWADKLIKNGEANHPSFFEFIFLMAMCYYCDKNPDYIILETGLGGRKDATNCIKGIAKTCVITEIGMDHMQYLGNTIREIAGEKAGIIHDGDTVIFMDKREEASSVILDKCMEMKTHFTGVKREDIRNITDYKEGISFDLKIGDKSYQKLEIISKAVYQCENAALAINTALLLGIDEDSIRLGIKNMRWPGRMELVAERVYLDGAHNEDGVIACLESVKNMPGEKILLFAVVADKNYEKMIEQIVRARVFEYILITKAGEDRATNVNMIADIYKKVMSELGEENAKTIETYENIEEAYNRGLEIRGERTLIVTGSLYLVGEIKGLIF